jgi:hypothetical protein
MASGSLRPSALITSLFVAIAAVALGTGGGWRFGKTRSMWFLQRKGVETVGEVLSSSAHPDGKWALLVRFVPFGANFAIEFDDYLYLPTFEDGPAVGAPVRVLYLDADPASARLAASTD